jgi:hypothetical protein
MSASRETMVSKPGSPAAISDPMNCRFASSQRTVVPAVAFNVPHGDSESDAAGSAGGS